jgi:site-specific recombinase XerD
MGRMEQAYERFLVRERGLTSATVKNYLPTVHVFLTERFGTETIELERLVAQDANQFILRHAQHLSRTRAKLLVTALRSFLRFLYQRGDIPIDLASALLPVMHWRLSGLPKSLAPEQVNSMLDSCDRSTVIGRRDYAILLLLARLGLRAGEVVALTLDDLDWDKGIVTVPGKGQRREPLPLPHEVGEALVGYLQDGRPLCNTRCLFVRISAPHRGFTGAAAICDVVRRALVRAGIDPPFKGSHMLRHSLATEMLRCGASLEDIGQILRHRHPETTQIYAKVDLEALRALAQPWPGGAT